MTWAEALRRGIVTPTEAREARLKPLAAAAGALGQNLGPQAVLTAQCLKMAPEGLYTNYRGLADRAFELDIAWPHLRVGLEVDGYQFHGKHIKGFLRDRVKDRLYTLEGWRVLRYAASEITVRNLPYVMDEIKRALTHAQCPTGQTQSY